jgi:hypothetical protein
MLVFLAALKIFAIAIWGSRRRAALQHNVSGAVPGGRQPYEKFVVANPWTKKNPLLSTWLTCPTLLPVKLAAPARQREETTAHQRDQAGSPLLEWRMAG